MKKEIKKQLTLNKETLTDLNSVKAGGAADSWTITIPITITLLLCGGDNNTAGCPPPPFIDKNK